MLSNRLKKEATDKLQQIVRQESLIAFSNTSLFYVIVVGGFETEVIQVGFGSPSTLCSRISRGLEASTISAWPHLRTQQPAFGLHGPGIGHTHLQLNSITPAPELRSARPKLFVQFCFN